ncbi:hypothetical protein O3M35_006191 [Rhynocoris fuscipes]|uniref:Reverse transcriptase domain-containing protein n=1 Tax=Rhynocoris fuscipes TaxID=488301 RepID=A0AAW1DHQ4_9HEMI
MNNLFDVKLASLATKDDVKALREDNVKLQQENQLLREEVDRLNKKFVIQEKRLDEIDMSSRRPNLIFRGFTYNSQVNLPEYISKFCIEVLNIETQPIIEKVVILGGQNKLIVVEFLKISDVHIVLKNAKKLKGTGVWIYKDLTFQERQRKKKLLEVRRKIKEKNGQAKVFVGNGFLLNENRKYFLDEERGIKSKNEEEFLEALKALYKCTECAVWTPKGLTDSFESKVGLKQGCLLSPTLFSLFMNDFNDFIEGGEFL